MSYRISLVDDDRHYARLMAHRLGKRDAYTVDTFESGEALLAALGDGGRVPDAVLLDIMMPGLNGLDVLRRLQRERPELPVVMISAQGVVETAIEAMNAGAYDYVTKGQNDVQRAEAVLERALEQVRLQHEVDTLRDEVEEQYGLDRLVGESEPMRAVYRLVRKAVRGRIPVAVQGESGTGKELVAKAIHYNSGRSEGPFVEVNCAAVPADLTESTFFGHEKGAFTDARDQRIGKFEQADGGTLFLDEISEMRADLQAKLLRALESRTVQRVGGDETIPFDARVICATNRDPAALLDDGALREDLYYRLFQFPVVLPPLRERGNDVLLLADHFRKAYLDDHPDLEPRALSAETRRALMGHPWPGNVRELKSVVERALLIAEGKHIVPADLMLQRSPAADAPASLDEATPPHLSVNMPESGDGYYDGNGSGNAPALRTLEELKRDAVARAYRHCDENATAAAEQLDIGRSTVYRLLEKYDLKE